MLQLCQEAEKPFRGLRLLSCSGCSPSSSVEPSIPPCCDTCASAVTLSVFVLFPLLTHFPLSVFQITKAAFSSPKPPLQRGCCEEVWLAASSRICATMATHQTCPSQWCGHGEVRSRAVGPSDFPINQLSSLLCPIKTDMNGLSDIQRL